MPFNYNDCIEEGFLRKIPPSKDKAIQSMKKAHEWLKDAENSFKGKAYGSAILASYNAMFHSARAILFYDGIREKSHACVARYLEEKYYNTGMLKKRWIDLLDHNREVRHNDQYDLSFFITKEEADKALESARLFLSRMENPFELISK